MTSFQDSNCPFPEVPAHTSNRPLSLFLSTELKLPGDRVNIDIIKHIFSLPGIKSHIFLTQIDFQLVRFHLELAGWRAFKNTFIRCNDGLTDIIIFNKGRQGVTEVALLTDSDNVMFEEIVECSFIKPVELRDSISDIIGYEELDDFFLVPGKYESETPAYDFKTKYASIRTDNYTIWRESRTSNGVSFFYESSLVAGDGVVLVPTSIQGAYIRFYISSLPFPNGRTAYCYPKLIKEKGLVVPDDVIRKEIKDFYNNFFVGTSDTEMSDGSKDIGLTPSLKEENSNESDSRKTSVSIMMPKEKPSFIQHILNYFK